MSASCSIAPDSRRSESCGLRGFSDFSTSRLSWDRTITGTFSSLARSFRACETSAISC